MASSSPPAARAIAWARLSPAVEPLRRTRRLVCILLPLPLRPARRRETPCLVPGRRTAAARIRSTSRRRIPPISSASKTPTGSRSLFLRAADTTPNRRATTPRWARPSSPPAIPDQALRYLEEAPQDNGHVLFAIGKIHLQAARWELARASISEKAVALSARFRRRLEQSRRGRGRCAKSAGRAPDFDKAIALNPDMSSALLNAGQARVALGERDAGEKLYRHALEINPKDATAANLLGELMAAQGKDGEARDWFQHAIEARRDYAPAINNLASLYGRIGQPNDAIAALRYGTEIAPDEESLYLNLASLYMRLDDREKAQATIERLLARKPGSALGKQALRELGPR